MRDRWHCTMGTPSNWASRRTIPVLVVVPGAGTCRGVAARQQAQTTVIITITIATIIIIIIIIAISSSNQSSVINQSNKTWPPSLLPSAVAVSQYFWPYFAIPFELLLLPPPPTLPFLFRTIQFRRSNFIVKSFKGGNWRQSLSVTE